MADPTRTPLGDITLVRDWYLDVNTGTYATPVWTPVYGIKNFQDTLDPTDQDTSDFDSEGYKASSVTALGWGVQATVTRKGQVATPTAYDPGQEVIRLAAENLGVDNTLDVRFYKMGAVRVEAYRGFTSAKWQPAGGSMEAEETVQATLTGQGKRNSITHPYPPA